MTTRLLLARHGAIDWSGRIGAPDDGLNALGRRQARALARRLARSQIAALYSSTLKRAAETAGIIAPDLGLDIRWEPRLREGESGEWMGLLEEEVKAKFPDQWRCLHNDLDFTPPGGETPAQLQQRTVAAVNDIVAAHPTGNVLLISHGGPISALVSNVLGLDFADLSRRYFQGRQLPFHFDHCSLSVIEFRDAGPVLTLLNDTSHLEQ